MDYTDLARLKNAMDSTKDTKDDVLLDYIGQASRSIDLMVTGMPGVANYFQMEDVVGEILTNGVVDSEGRLTVFPHKPVTVSVASLEYRAALKDTWKVADPNLISVEYESVVFEGGLVWSDKMYTRISYTGGFALTEPELPLDILELGTLLSLRLYKEDRSGAGDSIGVAELGTMVYTKAFPSRATEILRHYARVAPWT